MPFETIDLPFPVNGLNTGHAYSNQPPLTSPDEQNVRSYDPILDRLRGGQRDGISKFFPNQINSSNPIQALAKDTSLDNTSLSETVWTFGARMATNTDDGEGVSFDSNTKSVYYVDDRTTGNNVYRLDEDGALTWDSLIHAGSNPKCRISSDNTVLFVVGRRSASKCVWALDASDGSEITSVNLADSEFPGSLHICTISTGWRLAIGAANTSNHHVYVIDYNSTTQTFSTTWEIDIATDFSTNAVSADTRVWISNEDTDKLYVANMDGTTNLGFIMKFTISTNSQDWRYDMPAASAANAIFGLCAQNGLVYAGITGYTDVTFRNLFTINDAAPLSTPTQQAIGAAGDNTVNSIMVKEDSDGTSVVWCGVLTSSGNNIFKVNPTTLATLQQFQAGTTLQCFDIDFDPSTDDVFAAIVPVVTGDEGAVFKLNVLAAGELTRSTTILVVSGGNTYKLIQDPVDKGWDQTSIGTGTVVTGEHSVFAVSYSGKFYTVDGTNYRVIDPSVPSDSDWTTLLTAGSLPSSGSDTARLIETYQGRVCVALGANIVGSKINDPLDYDATPSIQSVIDAFNLNTGVAGTIGSVVMGMIPYNDDLMVVGTDQSIQLIRGNPSLLGGGRVDLVTDVIGMWWGRAWAVAPNGVIYFMATDGVYRMIVSGDQVTRPESISNGVVDQAFHELDPSRVRVRMAWNHRHRGLHVFINNIASIQSTHYFWEERTQAWHKDVIPQTMDPTSVLVFDGDDPKDRTILMGCRDGYIRRWDARSDDDDGTAINSYVVYPPVKTKDQTRETSIVMTSFSLGENTDSLTYEWRSGNSPEEALSSTSSISGTISTDGRIANLRHRTSGGALSLKLSNSNNDSQWAIERTSIAVRDAGPVRV